MKNLFSIGEFSRITGLPVKTLRFYHDERLLMPASIDPNTGYRYYSTAGIETARIITALRALEFSLDDIREILREHADDGDILVHLERQRQSIEQKLRRYRDLAVSVAKVIAHEREARMVRQNGPFGVEEKTIEPMWVAGIRMKGRYSDCGKVFGQLFRRFGRHVAGPPMLLHYDAEFKEADADFEPCVPLRKAVDAGGLAGVAVRQLPGGRCVTLIHSGPYDEMSRSYEAILRYIKEKGCVVTMPTRELYIKGPGMIFRGNPKKYLTEIQMLVG